MRVAHCISPHRAFALLLLLLPPLLLLLLLLLLRFIREYKLFSRVRARARALINESFDIKDKCVKISFHLFILLS